MLIGFTDPEFSVKTAEQVKSLTYKGEKYYNVNSHYYLDENGKVTTEQYSNFVQNNNENKRVSEWIYSDISPIVKSSDNVTYTQAGRNCYVAACKTIDNSGYKASTYYDKRTRQMILDKNAIGEEGDLRVPEQTKSEALDLIHKSLEEVKPVLVGVDNSEGHNGNFDKTTVHYVVIVGRGSDKQGEYFRYYNNTGSR